MINSFYIQRINKVIDYIEDNISKKLTLVELAGVAMFSKYHFHRIFKVVSGETLNNYIRRQKMEKAQRRISSDKNISISELSFELGYKSGANFSADFQKYFGFSPSEAKKNVERPIVRNIINVSDTKIDFKGIEYINEKKVIYKRVTSGYDPVIIQPIFTELYLYVQDNGLLKSIDQFIGIGYDDPDYTPSDKCRYDACMVLNAGTNIPDDLPYNIKNVAGGKYALFYFEGKKEQFLIAWDIIFKEWLLSSEYIPDDRPHLEMYLHSDRYEEGVYRANLCLPVKLIRK